MMRRTGLISLLVVACVLTLIGQAVSNNRTDDPLGVAVSPQTLLLGEDQGGDVMVHTYIPYGSVDRASLALNGIPVSWTKADSRGNLVAAFDEPVVKSQVEPPGAVLTLTGLTTDGDPFAGSDEVRVIESPAPEN